MVGDIDTWTPPSLRSTASRGSRLSADQRREQVLAAAVSIFGEKGYAAAGTQEIADAAGISQPYVVRLFGTKRDLFLAVLSHAWDRLENNLHRDPTLSEFETLPVLLQGFAASSDPVIRDAVRDRFGRFYELARSSGDRQASEVARRFLADRFLLTALATLQLVGPDANPTQWSRELLDDLRAGESRYSAIPDLSRSQR